MSISVEVEKPIIMGVLTTNTSEQAIERCSLQSELKKQTTQIKPAVGDKGIEFAQAALTMIENFRGDFVGESTLKTQARETSIKFLYQCDIIGLYYFSQVHFKDFSLYAKVEPA